MKNDPTFVRMRSGDHHRDFQVSKNSIHLSLSNVGL